MPLKSREGLFGEIVGDVAHRLVHPQAVAVGRRDADALLAAMLERVEAEVREIRGLRVAVDPEDAALFSELVHVLELGATASLRGLPVENRRQAVEPTSVPPQRPRSRARLGRQRESEYAIRQSVR